MNQDDDLNRTISDATPIEPVSTGRLRPSLVEIAGGEFGRRIFLDAGTAVLGRGDDATIRLSDARSSRRHATIETEAAADGQTLQCAIRDLSSRNGTFVNGQRVTAAPLHQGDKIQIGYTIFKFTLTDTVELEFENKIYELATTDPLTGLYTRDYFAKEFRRTLHHCLRYKRPMATLMIDLDNFKTINDTHGHLTGDHVLEAVAGLLKETLRSEDVAARYGGEEFIALMPETTAEAARFPAERFTRLLERHVIETPDGTALRVTASIGISGFPEHGQDEAALVGAADRALYAAKAAGKNRIVVADASDAEPRDADDPFTE